MCAALSHSGLANSPSQLEHRATRGRCWPHPGQSVSTDSRDSFRRRRLRIPEDEWKPQRAELGIAGNPVTVDASLEEDGVPLQWQVNREDVTVARFTVERLMREMGLSTDDETLN